MTEEDPLVKPCWRAAGLTPEGAEKADAVLDRMIALATEVGNETLMGIVSTEACFRVFALPKRTPAYQMKYLQENS